MSGIISSWFWMVNQSIVVDVAAPIKKKILVTRVLKMTKKWMMVAVMRWRWEWKSGGWRDLLDNMYLQTLEKSIKSRQPDNFGGEKRGVFRKNQKIGCQFYICPYNKLHHESCSTEFKANSQIIIKFHFKSNEYCSYNGN